MSWKIQAIEDLTQHAQAWDELQRRCGNVPFLETAFLLPALKEFGTGHELLAFNTEQGVLRAAAIVARIGTGRWHLFLPSQLPLGAWVSAPDIDVSAALESLLSALPGLPVVLSAPQLDSLLNPQPSDRERVRAQAYIDTGWVEVAGSFDDYWELRGKNLRQNTKKQRNKLQADGIEPQLECLTEPAQVEQAMQDYGALESAGWKAADGTAIHPGNAQGRFYRQMLENFCQLGRGRIYRYKFGDKVVSMDLCIASDDKLVILKTAYDESYKAISPSSLMRQEQFQQLFTSGQFKRIEFYGKVMEWHTRWTPLARPIYHLTVLRWNLLGRLDNWRRSRRQAEPAPPAVEPASTAQAEPGASQ